jgi:LmbE family N-acetylglucosaminyl deacetylase
VLPVTDDQTSGAPHGGDLGSLLGVFAHPDDEAYLAGALMALAVDAGRRVVCVTATRGELGFPDDDPRSIEERKALRTAELDACLGVLGVREHHWLDHPDGGCAAVPVDEPVAWLRGLIDDFEPDTVLTFGPDGGTYHEDHIAVSCWTTLACRAADADPRLLYSANTPEWVERFLGAIGGGVMMTDETPHSTPHEELAISFRADDALADRKLEALRAQASQVEPLVRQAGVEVYRELIREERFRDPTPADWAS